MLAEEDRLVGTEQLNFEPEVTWPLQQKGRQQACEAMTAAAANSSNTLFSDGSWAGTNIGNSEIVNMIDQWNSNDSLRQEYESVGDYLRTYLLNSTN